MVLPGLKSLHSLHGLHAVCTGLPPDEALDSDLGGWKLARTRTDKRGVKFEVYRTIARYASGNAFAFTSYCSFSNYISGCSNPRR